MNLKSVAAGYLYILTNEFPSTQMVTITMSTDKPQDYLQKLSKRSNNSQWILEKPVQILHSRFLENANLVEGKLHEFLVAHGFSGGTPKDYQISFEDALYLLDRLIFEKFLDPTECLKEITHTEILPPEGCNYYLLGTLFNSTYAEDGGESLDKPPKDEAVAFQCFKKGSEFQDERCTLELGRCYEYGMGVETNEKKALDYYQTVFAYKTNMGVNSLFRIHLKRGEPLKAGAVVETFVEYCEREAQLPQAPNRSPSSSEEDVPQILENHQQFVTILSELIWDCYQIHKDWEILEGYWDIFEEFSFSIEAYLEKQASMMEKSHFPDISANFKECCSQFSKDTDRNMTKTG